MCHSGVLPLGPGSGELQFATADSGAGGKANPVGSYVLFAEEIEDESDDDDSFSSLAAAHKGRADVAAAFAAANAALFPWRRISARFATGPPLL